MENEKFVCEICGKEHDGSYGSGRFCSNHCRHVYIGKQVKHHVCNFPGKEASSFGTWRCCHCDFIAKTQKELQNHKHIEHPEFSCSSGGGGWNKGRTKNDCPSIAKSVETFKNHIKDGTVVPHEGKHWTDEEKKHLSEKMKQYLKEHPERHVWKRIKAYQSVPCDILKKFLLENNINFYAEYHDDSWSHNYSIDIAFPNKRFGIEVNGNQHYAHDGNLQEYFQIRHDYLVSEGWTIIEIPYQMVWNDDFKNKLLKEIRQNADFCFDYASMMKEYIGKKKEQKRIDHTCPICGGYKKCKSSKMCKDCNKRLHWKDKPNKEEFEKMLFETPITELSKRWNISQRSIERLCKIYSITPPGRGYWSKQKR